MKDKTAQIDKKLTAKERYRMRREQGLRGQGEYPNLVVAEYTPEAWDELKLKEKQGVTDKNPVRQQKT